MSEPLMPFDEVMDEIARVGGESLNLCYQCGTCSASCPWSLVRDISVRKILNLAQLGLEGFESEEIWLCTTCRACASRCPRGVDMIDVIKAMRNIVAEGGLIPKQTMSVISNVMGHGNPWGSEQGLRRKWAEGLDVKDFSGKEEILWFVGCSQSYDPRNNRIARAMASVLGKAGVRFGILGVEEKCCGESLRKIGNESNFQKVAASNIELFQKKGVKRIVTSSPHCFNTFVKEYPEFGGEFEVMHYTQFIESLINEGRLKFKGNMDKRITYHDPCYLGRHNGIYDAPRNVIRAIPGAELIELGKNRENSLCCGGGGGRIWVETKMEERFSNLRAEEAKGVGAQILATSCPFCISNFEDSLKNMNLTKDLVIADIVELVDQFTL